MEVLVSAYMASAYWAATKTFFSNSIGEEVKSN